MAQTEEPAIARDCENCYLACGGTADHVSFAAKSSIFRPSDSATNTFLLQSGLVEIAVDADDNRALLALIKPGQLFGWSALFLGENYGWHARALRDCAACALSPELMVDLLLKQPSVVLSVLRAISRCVRQGARLAAIRSHPSVAARLGALLDLLGEEVSIRTADGRQVVTFTHQELAEMIGSTRPTVTRQLHLLRRKGLVALQKKRVILKDRGGNG